jgi:ATP-binding cassette subfamily B protein
MALLEFGVLYYAYYYWMRGQFSIGDFAFLQAYLMNLFSHVWDFAYYIRSTYESIADANEMTEMLIQPHSIVDNVRAKKLKISKGEINFKDIDFSYSEDKPILDNFNLHIAAGERVALVGQSGGGKSTIVKILFRFMDLNGGQILIDGQDISKVTQDSLREQISLVPQEPLLFHRSLLDNIRYGRPDSTEQEVIKAAKAAHCHEFISGFEQGYNTLVGERGVKLSGGERQRVAIARAILRNAPILVLDEATSSLDSESESLIQDALKTLMKGKTTIVIAHRLSTIREMDRIVVIEGGKIIEQGKHDELVKAQQGIYQKLWNIQVGGFANK